MTKLEKKRKKNREYMRNARRKDPEKFRARNRAWQKNNKDKADKQQAAWRRRNPGRVRRNARKWRAENIELVRDARMRKAGHPATRPRPEICECCGGPPNGKGVMHLDHCHVTGKFRGWLCHSCNLGIGHLKDNLAGVLNAVKYLQTIGKIG